MTHWDQEIEMIKQNAQHIATHHKATAMLGIAVDDNVKRDYFVPRLQKILDENSWARHLTFRIVPMFGQHVDLVAKGEEQ